MDTEENKKCDVDTMENPKRKIPRTAKRRIFAWKSQKIVLLGERCLENESCDLARNSKRLLR